jgi:N-acyl-D-aspartate/D-glutamate deacylase
LRYVQASGEALMSLEKAVWRLTKENADFFNLDAGHLAAGKRGDVVVIDPQKLTDDVHRISSAEFMTGFSRLVNRDDDVVELVMIGGTPAWRSGAFTAAFGKERLGTFLRGTHA